MLAQYEDVGVTELDEEKLPPLLKLKYRDSPANARKELGKLAEVGRVPVRIQKYLHHVPVEGVVRVRGRPRVVL